MQRKRLNKRVTSSEGNMKVVSITATVPRFCVSRHDIVRTPRFEQYLRKTVLVHHIYSKVYERTIEKMDIKA